MVCEAHEDWGRRFQARHPPLPPLTAADVDTTPGRPLVVSSAGGGRAPDGRVTGWLGARLECSPSTTWLHLANPLWRQHRAPCCRQPC
jgi:hypothetical protein